MTVAPSASFDKSRVVPAGTTTLFKMMVEQAACELIAAAAPVVPEKVQLVARLSTWGAGIVAEAGAAAADTANDAVNATTGRRCMVGRIESLKSEDTGLAAWPRCLTCSNPYTWLERSLSFDSRRVVAIYLRTFGPMRNLDGVTVSPNHHTLSIHVVSWPCVQSHYIVCMTLEMRGVKGNWGEIAASPDEICGEMRFHQSSILRHCVRRRIEIRIWGRLWGPHELRAVLPRHF